MDLATEQNQALDLKATRHADRTSENKKEVPKKPAETSPDITPAQWAFIGFACFGVWVIGLLLDLIIPFETFIANYLTVLALWMWAKGKGLNPPTFFSSINKGAAVTQVATGPAAGAGKGAVKVGEALEKAVPGSDIVYILVSGVTPLIYFFGLVMGNRKGS